MPSVPAITVPDLSGLLGGLTASNPWQTPQPMPAPQPNGGGWWAPQPQPQPQPQTQPQPAPQAPCVPPTQPVPNGWWVPQPQPTPSPWPAPTPAPGSNPGQTGATGQVVGVFAGITNYNGANDLPGCADDAVRLAQAFINAGIIRQNDAVVLTDHQATRANISAAIRNLSTRVPSGGTLVFFFSGHGDNTPDSNGDEVDGMDETIILSDGPMSDDELVSLLQGGSRDMVALDTCYAGGFQQDVARIPQSIGFYSSAEDQTSQVASEFGAGGYLSHFLRTGVEASRGQPLQVGRLQQHIEQGYMTSGAAGQQRLVVGVGPGASTSTVIYDGQQQPVSVAVR